MSDRDVRAEVMSIWSVIQFAKILGHAGKRIDTLRMTLAYAVEVWPRKKRIPVDVKATVEVWVPIIRGLSSAHSKEEVDRCEFEMETHLTPLLTAPVKQLREFYASLVEALKEDPGIPLFVWCMFDAYHEVMVKKAVDSEILELKKDLAKEIADLVEEDVRPDVGKAIAAALQWRAPEQLEAVRDAIKKGAKPRLTGRESCLFLEVGDVVVML